MNKVRNSSIPRRLIFKSERQKLLEQIKREISKNQNGWAFYLTEKDAPMQEIREDGFINSFDRSYLDSYAIENMMDLISREELNRYDGLLSN